MNTVQDEPHLRELEHALILWLNVTETLAANLAHERAFTEGDQHVILDLLEFRLSKAVSAAEDAVVTNLFSHPGSANLEATNASNPHRGDGP